MTLRERTGILRQMRQLQLTLRKMQDFLSLSMFRPRFWAIFAMMIVLFSVVGPFGTFDRMALPVRFLYWSVTMLGSWLIAMVSIALIEAVLQERLSIHVTIFLGCVLASVPITFYLDQVIPLFLPFPSTFGFWNLLLYTLPISVTFGVIVHLALSSDFEAAAREKNKRDPAYDNFINRLPPAKRGEVQYMSMQDHYVSVTTTKGTELVLMRMADAIAALPNDIGTQIHRSHWVAKSAVTDSTRKNGQPHVIMQDGTELPVSRSFVKAAREEKMIS